MFSAILKGLVTIITLVLVCETDGLQVPAIDAVKVEYALTDGMTEVKAAIALRDKIIARGHDFNKDPIPEFEEHLPHIIAFYSDAFKGDATKMKAFHKRVEELRASFKKNAVFLRDWNDFHGFLNRLVDSDSGTFYGTQVFDSFICFIYRNNASIGVQTQNFADASGIAILPMTTTPKVRMRRRELTASEYTNALLPFFDPFKGAEPGALLAIYNRIEKLETLTERATAHFALYNLLRQSNSPPERLFDSTDISERLSILRDELAQGLLNIPSKINLIYRAIRFQSDDDVPEEILIEQINAQQYLITGETLEGAPLRFTATVKPNTDRTFQLTYTSHNGVSQDLRVEEAGNELVIDRNVRALASLLSVDIHSTDTVLKIVDDFVARQITTP